MKPAFEANPESKESSFLRSALTLENRFQSLDDVRGWLRACASRPYRVEEIPLSELDGWSLDPDSGDLKHASGLFFTVHGLGVQTNFPDGVQHGWQQPIIDQPEVGILGILSKVFDGVRYFLIQAKMEPGNCNLVQLSPTLQATKSNFTRVHHGKSPRYLEYFVDPEARILVDQLQSEQGCRFLRKRNRNMVIDVEHEPVVHEDFRWLTLAELKLLLDEDDVVNMDTRTVLSCLQLADSQLSHSASLAPVSELRSAPLLGHQLSSGFGRELLVSILAGKRLNTTDDIISWLTRLKTSYELETSYVPLNEVEEWGLRDGAFRHALDRYFSVIGVRVGADEREVSGWTQPILKHTGLGLVGLLVQRINGVLHFLAQARVEPGHLDILEISPTVSTFDIERRHAEKDVPPFFEHFFEPDPARVRYSTIQSEEGGRFYHLRGRYMVVELPENEPLDMPDNYMWMTLGQLFSFVRYNNYLNIELRGLLSCLSLVAR